MSDTPTCNKCIITYGGVMLAMLMWCHELSMLLIHHCISAIGLADNLIFR